MFLKKTLKYKYLYKNQNKEVMIFSLLFQMILFNQKVTNWSDLIFLHLHDLCLVTYINEKFYRTILLTNKGQSSTKDSNYPPYPQTFIPHYF